MSLQTPTCSTLPRNVLANEVRLRALIAAALATALGAVSGCAGVPEDGDNAVEETTAALSQSGFKGWRQIPPGLFSSGAAAVSLDPQSVYVFGRGTLQPQDDFYQGFGFSTPDGSSWTWSGGWTPMGGRFNGKPSATGFNSGCIAVVGRATNNVAYVDVFQHDSTGTLAWTGWAPIPNGVFAQDMAITFASSTLFVIGADTNNNLEWASNNVSAGYNVNNWSGWHLIPNSSVNSEVAAAARGLDLFVAAKRPTDNFMYLIKSGDAGTTWSGWTKINFTNTTTTWTGGPALVVSPGGQLNAFTTWYSGTHNIVLNVTSNDGGTSWGSLAVLTGVEMTSGPAATSPDDGNIQLIARTTDNSFYLNPFRQ